jgi:hypothetical protein
MILRSFYNGAFSIASKHDFDDQFFCARDSMLHLRIIFNLMQTINQRFIERNARFNQFTLIASFL